MIILKKINLHSFAYFHNPIEYLNVIIQGIQSFFLNLHSNVKKRKRRKCNNNTCSPSLFQPTDINTHVRAGLETTTTIFIFVQFAHAYSEDDHRPSYNIYTFLLDMANIEAITLYDNVY
jgi:hypothetical protein